MKIVKVQLDKIEQNENSRVGIKEADMSELMTSLKRDGLLQPVGVKSIGHGKYEAVFGNRRIIAARKLGWYDIDTHVLDDMDERERDIIGLVENLKRQNTSPAEDGRMFQSFIKRGMNIDEIAARLDITKKRVQTSLDIFHQIPLEFQSKIKFQVGRRKNSEKRKVIPASVAVGMLSLKSSHDLSSTQMQDMLAYAKETGTGIQKLQQAAPLVKQGFDVEKAIQMSDDRVSISLRYYMKKRSVARIQGTTGKRIHELITELIAKHFPIEKFKTGGLKLKRYKRRQVEARA